MTRSITFVAEGDVNSQIKITENLNSSLSFTIQVLGENAIIGDLRAIFFDVNGLNLDETGLYVYGDDVTDSIYSEAGVDSLGRDANIKGLVSNELGNFDVGIEFGTSGMSTDDIQSTSFTLIYDSNGDGKSELSLDLLNLTDFGLRYTSVGEVGGNRNSSAKIGARSNGVAQNDALNVNEGSTNSINILTADIADTNAIDRIVTGVRLSDTSDFVPLLAEGFELWNNGQVVALVTVEADGTATIDAVGQPGAEVLAQGESIDNLSFEYQSEAPDGSLATATVSVTVTGTNDLATISGINTGNMVEDVALFASGQLTVNDLDNGEAFFQVINEQLGTYGNFSIDSTGNWSYQLNNESANLQNLTQLNNVTDSFVVASLDGTATETFTINIQGTADGNSYYFDSNAVSNGDGSENSPFNSLSEVSNLNLSGGDRIFLKRGSVFYETLDLDASGQDGNPIVVNPYGVGEKPVISGGQSIPAQSSEWLTTNQNGEYRSILGTSPTSQPVLIKSTGNGEEYQLVEYGGFDQKGNLSAGTYTLSRETIDYVDSSNPFFGSFSWVVYYKPLEENSVTENPNDFSWEVSQRDSAVNITGDYVEVHDLNGRLVNGEAVLLSSGNNTVFNNTDASFGKAFGIAVQGSNSTINEATAQYNYSTGLVLLTSGSVNGTISNSISRLNGNLILAGRTDRGGIGTQSDNSTIFNNLIYRNGDINSINLVNGPGDDAIALFDNNNALVANNYIFNSAGTAISMSRTENSYGHTIVDNVVGNWNLYGVGGDDKAAPYNSGTGRGTYAIGVFGNPLETNEGDFIVENNRIYSNQTEKVLIGIQAGLSNENDWMGDTVIQNNDVYIQNNNNIDTIGLRLVRDSKIIRNGTELSGFEKVAVDNNNIFVAPSDDLPPSTPRNYFTWRTGGLVDTAQELSSVEVVFNEGTTEELSTIYEANTTNSSSSEFLFGDETGETIMGTSNSEYLIGFSGDDTLTGGEGNDTFIGGEGNDQFIFATGSGDDIITDFEVGEDIIVLEAGLTITGIAEETYDNIYYQRIDSIVTFSSGDQVTLYNVADLVDSSQLI